MKDKQVKCAFNAPMPIKQALLKILAASAALLALGFSFQPAVWSTNAGHPAEAETPASTTPSLNRLNAVWSRTALPTNAVGQVASFASARPQAKTYTVNSKASDADAIPGDGTCATPGGQCTLHAAIQEANTDGSASTVNLSQKFQTPNYIAGCGLPSITESGTTIDASNRWDTTDDSPGVEIVDMSCALLTINASDTAVMGLSFGGTDSTGVHIIGGGNNSIGGTGPGQRNVFLTGKYGVHIQSSGAVNYVLGNYFGTVDGASLPGGGMGLAGVHVQWGPCNISSNLIVGQSVSGISLGGQGSVVTGNIIGLNEHMTFPLPNQVGVTLGGDSNVVGPGNVIAGNTSHGVYVYRADNNAIVENDIRNPRISGGMGNGGDGIHIHASLNTQITGRNVIYNNTDNGVYAHGSPGVTIQGSIIDSNGQDGVHFKNSDKGQIGGSGSSPANSIGGNTGHGIHLDASNDTTITGNYIGLETDGFDWGNHGYGILIDNGSTNSLIGGPGLDKNNWIGWNHQDGIHLDGSTTHHNYVQGNVIGASSHWGWAAPNGWHGVGIYGGAHDNWIGTLEAGNTILASGWSGVAIVNSSNNVVMVNRIGTDGGDNQWGNAFYGVNVVGNSSSNKISFNEIAHNGAHNGEAGVQVDGGVGNAISQNSIHDNAGPGIQLVNNGNIDLPAPTIIEASCQGPVSGKAGGPGWIIEIFSDNADEGNVFEASVTASTHGDWSWNGTPKGPNVTATARGQSDDTSPFSAPLVVGPCSSGHRVFLPLVRRAP